MGLLGVFTPSPLVMTQLKYQIETLRTICRVGFKSVTWGLQQVDISISFVVNEVKVIQFKINDINTESVVAVVFCLEADWSGGARAVTYHRTVYALVWNVNLGVVLVKHEFGQIAGFTKADYGTV